MMLLQDELSHSTQLRSKQGEHTPLLNKSLNCILDKRQAGTFYCNFGSSLILNRSQPNNIETCGWV